MKRVASALLALAMFAMPNCAWAASLRAQRSFVFTVVVQAPPVVFLPPVRGLALIAPLQWLTPFVVVGANQGAAKVNANVISDPNANLLVVNPDAPYTMTQTAGTTATYTCPFTVQVNYKTTPYTLYDGLASDFATGFPSTDLAWAVYASTSSPPSPETFTGYYNYYTNNKVWQVTKSTAGIQTFCVDLRLTVPSTVAPGTYYATVAYSLYY
jgi:hypothetical protein